jgi:hypothetical protein
LQVRRRARRKKRLRLHRGIVAPASGRDQAWSMDFVHDQLVTGRSFRVLTVIDQWSRESVLMEATAPWPVRASWTHSRRCRRVVPCPRRSRSITAPHLRPRLSTSGRTGGVSTGLHPTRKARGERVYREF